MFFNSIMASIKAQIPLIGAALGIFYNIAWITLWWIAALGSPDWTVVVIFNRFNEQIFEGILLHVTILVLISTFVTIWKIRR